MSINSEEKLRPPRALPSLKTGLDTIINNLYLILFPLVLDLFLWMGPRLRLHQIFDLEKFANYLQNSQVLAGSQEQVYDPAITEYVIEGIKQFNLFKLLSGIITSVPTLYQSLATEVYLFISPTDIDLSSQPQALSLSIILLSCGFIVGVVYYFLIWRRVTNKQIEMENLFKSLPRSALHIVLFGITLLIATGLIMLLFSLFVVISIITNIMFIQILGFILLFVLAISLFFLIFTPYVIISHELTFIDGMKSSVNLLKRGAPASIFLFAWIATFNYLTGTFWRMGETNAITILLSLIANSIISSALIAGVFVFTKDLMSWQQQNESVQRNNNDLSVTDG